MLSPDYNDKDAISEHLLTKYLVSGVLLASVFFAGMKIMNDVIDEAEHLSYEIKQERLEGALSYVHQQWNQRGRPDKMTLSFHFQDGAELSQKVLVNHFGWPINIGGEDIALNCNNLWRFLVLEQVTLDVDIEGIEIGQTRHTCLFAKHFGKNRTWMVEYNTENGRLVNK